MSSSSSSSLLRLNHIVGKMRILASPRRRRGSLGQQFVGPESRGVNIVSLGLRLSQHHGLLLGLIVLLLLFWLVVPDVVKLLPVVVHVVVAVVRQLGHRHVSSAWHRVFHLIAWPVLRHVVRSWRHVRHEMRSWSHVRHVVRSW